MAETCVAKMSEGNKKTTREIPAVNSKILFCSTTGI